MARVRCEPPTGVGSRAQGDTRRELVRNMLWPHCFQGNAMTRWGTVMEDVCCREFAEYWRTARQINYN